MAQLFFSRISLVWLVLAAATFLSFDAGHGLFADLRVVRCVILAVAFIKVRFVLQEFMELREAPWLMRRGADGWAIIVCGVLITLYLLPQPA